ncbi:MAG: hypothetical protein IJZ19_12990 [Lentisphaeria bacterium]|nr:hypothetical protein [Lentisphaeria bacterium]
MESYLMITQINDFIFCPRSIYYSGIFRDSSDCEVYHQTPQTIGKAAHETVDNNTYSSRKDIITGLADACNILSLKSETASGFWIT